MNRLEDLDLSAAFSVPIVDHQMAECCRSAVWLLHDRLDESHTISQDIETSTGSYWHAIMHRREPDYPNSKYWFRRVGTHPVFGRLADEAARLVHGSTSSNSADVAFLVAGEPWDAFRFVDLCEQVYRSESEGEALCRQICHLEWQLLFDYCYGKAITQT